jgi:hypothetical protein
MKALAPNRPVRLRPGRGVFLAVQWNLPLVLLFWYPWTVFHLAMVANCFLWALGCYLAGRVPWCRAILFRPSREGVPPRWRAAALWMAVLGTAGLIGWFLK